MKHRDVIIVCLTFILILLDSCAQKDKFPVLKGPYLGQKPPGDVPEIFAPGIVSTEINTEFSCTFAPDGSEFYFTRRAPDGENVIYYTKIENGVWIQPVPVKFTENYASHEPFITADNKYLYYGSWRPNPDSPDEELTYGIWKVERTSQGWSEPNYMGFGMYVTAALNGSIYLTDLRGSDASEQGIAKTTLADGRFSELIRQKGGVVNPAPDRHPGRHPFIAPDESFIIFDAYEKETGLGNLFICYRKKEGNWGKAIRLHDEINKRGCIAATISPDGKYLFFASRENDDDVDLFWVKAKIVEELKPNELK